MTRLATSMELLGNRAEFIALLEAYGLTQAKAAELISKYTHRPLSVRAVRTWVNNPDKPSSRKCPEWAVNALREAIKLYVVI